MSDKAKQADLFEDGEASKLEEKRQKVLAQVRDERKLTSLQARVAYILSQYPETRNSDVTLQLQYWQVFQRSLLSGGMVAFENMYKLERLTSLKRARAYIQNDLKLFRATDERVARHRKQLNKDHRDEYAPKDIAAPSIFVYADESGKNADQLLVGSVWLLATGEYPRFLVETNDWKDKNDVDYEFHSSEVTKHRVTKYREFIERFVLREGILGFKAISIPNRGFQDEGRVFADLYYWLIRRGLEHEVDSKKIVLPRRLSFAKDAEEEGYDHRVLALIRDQLDRDVEPVFNGELHCDRFTAVDSKQDILIQVADLFSWCVNRKLNVMPGKKKLNWKDEFAEWFMNEVQFSPQQEIMTNDRAVNLSLQSPTINIEPINIYETPEEELKKLEKNDKGEGNAADN